MAAIAQLCIIGILLIIAWVVIDTRERLLKLLEDDSPEEES